MSAPILNQPWDDVSADVCGAIQSAVQPLLKKAVDDIYGGLLDTTQDYLTENLAFNIASRIDAAEREAQRDRERCAAMVKALEFYAKHVPVAFALKPAKGHQSACDALDLDGGELALTALAKVRGEA